MAKRDMELGKKSRVKELERDTRVSRLENRNSAFVLARAEFVKSCQVWTNLGAGINENRTSIVRQQRQFQRKVILSLSKGCSLSVALYKTAFSITIFIRFAIYLVTRFFRYRIFSL